MTRLREMMVTVMAGTVMCALLGCQNVAGNPGNVPLTCAEPGSSCESSN